jgi:hypothetical protein
MTPNEIALLLSLAVAVGFLAAATAPMRAALVASF